MNVTFEFCGELQRLAGAGELSLSMPAGSLTVAAALAALAQRLPQLQERLPRCACAVGDVLVRRGDVLAANARLALLPPVAGG